VGTMLRKHCSSNHLCHDRLTWVQQSMVCLHCGRPSVQHSRAS
jgi:hypothetical protein